MLNLKESPKMLIQSFITLDGKHSWSKWVLYVLYILLVTHYQEMRRHTVAILFFFFNGNLRARGGNNRNSINAFQDVSAKTLPPS